MWSVLSVMAVWHRAWAHVTRHSKILIRLSCMGTESLWILGFVSDRARLSALWSRSSWPDYSCLRSRANRGFECWSSHASLPVCFWLSVQAIRCYSHLARPCKVFHNWGKRCCLYKNKTNATEVIFHYMKCICVHNAAPWLNYWPHEPMQQAINKNLQQKFTYI